MSVKIFVEGGAAGPDSKYLQVRCREGFHKLFSKCGLPRQPAIKACGGRESAFRDFAIAHSHSRDGDYVVLLVDSEELVNDIEQPWAHLTWRDHWSKPFGVTDKQGLLMTTCMESWIAADRQALRDHFGANLQENALPSLHAMESRDRHVVQDSLAHATRNCRNAYRKGKRSFELLAKLRPDELRKHLPSFQRCERLLKENL